MGSGPPRGEGEREREIIRGSIVKFTPDTSYDSRLTTDITD